jgi:hypothetical protein
MHRDPSSTFRLVLNAGVLQEDPLNIVHLKWWHSGHLTVLTQAACAPDKRTWALLRCAEIQNGQTQSRFFFRYDWERSSTAMSYTSRGDQLAPSRLSDFLVFFAKNFCQNYKLCNFWQLFLIMKAASRLIYSLKLCNFWQLFLITNHQLRWVDSIHTKGTNTAAHPSILFQIW